MTANVIEKDTVVVNPAVDIIEHKDHYALKVDIPGAEEKTLEVTVDKGILTLKASLPKSEEVCFTHKEYCSATAYERAFRLPDGVDTEGIKASIKYGVLTVTVPKAEEKKPRKIEITA